MDTAIGKPIGPAFASRVRRTVLCVLLVATVLFAFGSQELLDIQARHAAVAQARLVTAALVPGRNGDLSASVRKLQEHFPSLVAVGTLRVDGTLGPVYPDRPAHREAMLVALSARRTDEDHSSTAPVASALELSSPENGTPLSVLAVIAPLNGDPSPASQRACILLEHPPDPLGWVEASAAFLLLATTLGFMSHLSISRWFEREVAAPLGAMADVVLDGNTDGGLSARRALTGWRETTLIARRFEELVWQTAQSVAHADQVRREAKRRLVERERGFDQRLRRAEDKATLDPLTGLRNRTFMEERLERIFDRLRARPGDFCFVMLDLDNFKRYNDTHGHQVGDALLRFVGALLRGSLRTADHAIRYGGDEFLLILSDTNTHEAAMVADRIVKLFAQYVSRLGRDCGLSMSAGVAGQAAHRCATGHALLHAADRALYAAKRDGKNRVSVLAIADAACEPQRTVAAG